LTHLDWEHFPCSLILLKKKKKQKKTFTLLMRVKDIY
jgi:hypothetical protein